MSGRKEREIQFQVTGEGDAVTLLHAMGSGLEMWAKQVTGLSPHFKVLTPNTRGFGENPGPPVYSLSTWVEDIQHLLSSLEIRKTCLVGFSMGGIIAAQFALRFPDYLQGLVFAGSLGELSEAAVKMFQMRAELAKKEGIEPVVENTLNGFSEDFKKAHPEVINWYAGILRKNTPQGYAYACRVLWESAGVLPLNQISCPLLVIRGIKDPLISPEAVAQFKKRVPRAVFKEIPDCAHFAPLEQPEAFNTVLEGFLREIY